MKDYSKESLKVYIWMGQGLNLDPEIVYYYADLFQQTGEGTYKTIIDMEELQFWTKASSMTEILENLRELEEEDLISLEGGENGDYIVGIKQACRVIVVNREDSNNIIDLLKHEPNGVDIATIYTKMCILGYSTYDYIFIDRFKPMGECLSEALFEDPEDIEKALCVLKGLDAVDY